MAISTITSETAADTEAPKKRTKKADRPAVPEGGPIVVSDLGLADKLFKHIKAQRRSWTPKNVYASSILDDRRAWTLKLLGVPETDDPGVNHPEWAAVADFGTELHELIESWLKGIGVIAKDAAGKEMTEYRVRSECGSVSGRMDAMVEIHHEKYILDVKTVGRKDYDEGAHGPKFKKYIAQLNLYGYILGVTKGIILLVCRDSARMQEFIIELDTDEGKRLVLRAKALMRCAAQKRLPTAEQSGREMFFNPYKTLSLLEDRTGWAQRWLDDGKDPKEMTPQALFETYGAELSDEGRETVLAMINHQKEA